MGVSNTPAYYSNYNIAGEQSFKRHAVVQSIIIYRLKQLTRARCLLADNPMDCSSNFLRL